MPLNSNLHAGSRIYTSGALHPTNLGQQYLPSLTAGDIRLWTNTPSQWALTTLGSTPRQGVQIVDQIPAAPSWIRSRREDHRLAGSTPTDHPQRRLAIDGVRFRFGIRRESTWSRTSSTPTQLLSQDPEREKCQQGAPREWYRPGGSSVMNWCWEGKTWRMNWMAISAARQV